MFSTTSTYALRALAHLAARSPDEPAVARDIARELGIPPGYLSKILGQLVRSGVLSAVRGLKGGYRLARPADRVSLAEVVSLFEDTNTTERCVVGTRRSCSEHERCRAHNHWRLVVDAYTHFLEATTLADLSSSGVAASGGLRPRARRRASR